MPVINSITATVLLNKISFILRWIFEPRNNPIMRAGNRNKENLRVSKVRIPLFMYKMFLQITSRKKIIVNVALNDCFCSLWPK